MFKERNLKNWIITLPIIAILTTSFILTNIFITQQKKQLEEDLINYKDEYISSLKSTVKQRVNNLIKVIDENNKIKHQSIKHEIVNIVNLGLYVVKHVYEKNSHLEKKEILKLIDKKLRDMRFFENNTGYYFITKLDGTNVMMPIRPSFEGKNLSSIKDDNARTTLLEFMEILKKEGKGYYEYSWYEPHRNKISKKIGYAEVFKPLGILIGTARYYDDIEKIIQNETKELLNSIEFENKNYIFSYDYKGNTIAHIKKNLLGTNRWTLKRDKIDIIQKLISIGKSKNGGFVEYTATINPSTKRKDTKISFINHLNGIDWIVGTGLYTTDLNNKIEEKRASLELVLNETIKKIVILAILVTLFILSILLVLANKINAIFRNYQDKIQKKNDTLKDKIKERTKEQDSLLALFNQGDNVLFKWEANNDWTVSYVSDSVENIFGYSKKEFLEKKITYIDCIHEKDVNTVKREVENAINGNKNYFKHTPYRIYTKDKKVKWILDYTLVNRDKDGKIINFLGYIADISLIKDTEKLMVEQSKMASLGEMLGNIAHQWRQPLSTISTAASGIKLQKEMDILSDSLFYESCDGIIESSKFLSQTIDDFRDFIKGDKAKQEFCIKESIEKNLILIKGNIKRHNLQIVGDYDNSIRIYNYPQELIQVMMNIFNNAKDALKYNNKDDERYIFINTSEDENSVYIEIKDNAGGIPEDIIDKIFEPYFTTKSENDGTGLGLYMTKQLIEDSMKGAIKVKNSEFSYNNKNYKGACFTITLAKKI